jgi:hypothetical protein
MRLAAAALVASALAVGAQGATTQSGLRGMVVRGPVTPVCVAEQPCYAPAAGAVLAFSRNGAVVRTTVRSDGSYRVLLAPGLYTVRAVRRPLDPPTALVRRGHIGRVDFRIDTGIRYVANVASSGLRGVVKQLKRPVCVAGTRCDGFARRATLVFVRAGHASARVTTNDAGAYRVRLAPGVYAVRVAGGGVGRLKPELVTVQRARWTQVDFVYDSGIRVR